MSTRYPKFYKPAPELTGTGMERQYIFQKWFSPQLLSRTIITLAELPLVGVRMVSEVNMPGKISMADTQISLGLVVSCSEQEYNQEFTRIMTRAKESIKTMTGAEEAEVLP